ncbi:MAG TPA: winged helix-turn-helix domain-containing protein [Acidimicrobiales bacterium]|nr:winged helix-turn-helix domain-containing protein [Acidimicrobiales bacterium]
MVERQQPTPEQIKAVASPLRLRILRLCNDREWTNKELAVRLERDPATILHHLRLLVAAGLLEPVGVRQGESGAYEKPYRSTGLSWHLSFEAAAEDEEHAGERAMLSAFRQELAEAGHDSIAELTRFHVHLDDEGVKVFTGRLLDLLEEYRLGDDARRRAGAPGYGGVVVVHRLADTPPAAPPPADP